MGVAEGSRARLTSRRWLISADVFRRSDDMSARESRLPRADRNIPEAELHATGAKPQTGRGSSHQHQRKQHNTTLHNATQQNAPFVHPLWRFFGNIPFFQCSRRLLFRE
ncbi:hypothetical protein PHYPO_G00141470 [Pangasianodon hypophthalmus]|uniref:Uncharacterized protein n=1 Tax=Pangasianodon hypophthalmus TaxID=310915 RepID=A0A5N5KDZ7_PANHP|nr:hypothetical protein PHYPO_G00141470 [Pangasianodon hypophthalmus]